MGMQIEPFAGAEVDNETRWEGAADRLSVWRHTTSAYGVPVAGQAPYVGAMNREHLELCASAGWRQILRDLILPFALAGSRLGDDVLEIGPGPGVTTDLLRHDVARLTAVELDDQLAAALAVRLAGTNVDVVNADAAAMPFDDGHFTGAVSVTMLHHVPTAELQDRLFAEVARVLRHGGQFVASDSVASADLAALHHDDTYNPVDPDTVAQRLSAAGFSDVDVRANAFGWVAHAARGT
jgi:SAM-dependent methyltransferase